MPSFRRSSRDVAQLCKLLYRGFATRWPSSHPIAKISFSNPSPRLPAHALPITNRRYGSLQSCATTPQSNNPIPLSVQRTRHRQARRRLGLLLHRLDQPQRLLPRRRPAHLLGPARARPARSSVRRPVIPCILVEKNDGIKGLILGAGRHIVLGQSGEKMFQLLFTRQMSRQLDHKIAETPEPGAVALLRAQRKMFTPNDIDQLLHSFVQVHGATLTDQNPVAYQKYSDTVSYIKS